MWIVKSCDFYLYREVQQCKGKHPVFSETSCTATSENFSDPKQHLLRTRSPTCYSLNLSL